MLIHTCYLGLEGADLPKYSRFLLSLRYCTLTFLSLKAPFTEVIKLSALTSVLHSCFLDLEGAGLPKYSRFLLSLRYCSLAFSSLELTVYRSIRDFCPHFGIAVLLSLALSCRFTEVFKLLALTSVLRSCFLEFGLTVYRSNQAFSSHFGI